MEPEDAVVGSRSFVSPISVADSVLNSTAGIVASFGLDWYGQTAMEEAVMRAGQMTWDADTNTISNKLPKKAPSKIDLSRRHQQVRKAYTRGYNQRIGLNYSLRHTLRGSSAKDPNWITKVSRMVWKAPEELAHTSGVRAAAAAMENGSIAVSSATRRLASMGLKAHGLGIAMFSVGLAAAGSEIGGAVINSLHDRGVTGRRLSRNAMNTQSFSDSRMAYTSRQRALQAIQVSQSGYKRALGNEASYIHTVR